MQLTAVRKLEQILAIRGTKTQTQYPVPAQEREIIFTSKPGWIFPELYSNPQRNPSTQESLLIILWHCILDYFCLISK